MKIMRRSLTNAMKQFHHSLVNGGHPMTGGNKSSSIVFIASVAILNEPVSMPCHDRWE
jgi:prephenate dehydrogenase